MRTRKASDQLSLFLHDADTKAILPTIRNAADYCEHSVEGYKNKAIDAYSESIPAEILPIASEGPGNKTECDWSQFFYNHGRVPTIQDEKKPWEYRGWLLYYRWLLEEVPNVGRRWEFWCRTMRAGKLLDEDIPPLSICNAGDKEVFKSIDSWLRLVDRYWSGWTALEKLLDWFLWGFGHSKVEPAFSPELNESLYRNVNIGPMLVAPYDYWGEWIALQRGEWNPNAFYPTPHSIVEFMVQAVCHDSPEDLRVKTVYEPCVGSGRMLMHASNYSLRLYGVDKDATLVKVTYVNGALYVPWILRPFPEQFFIGREAKKSLA